MVDQQLLDFIKTQSEQGYDPSQIKAFLLQHGYGNDAIDEALETYYRRPAIMEFFQAKTPITGLGLIFAILFMVSLLFSTIMIGQLVQGVGVFLLFIFLYVILYSLYAKQKRWAVNICIILLIILFFFISKFLFALNIIFLLFSIAYNLNQPTKMSMLEYGFFSFIAGVISIAASFLLFLIVVYPMIHVASFGNIYLVVAYLSICLFVLVTVYLYVFSEIIHSVDEDFDVKMQFHFRFFPYSIFNFLYRQYEERARLKLSLKFGAMYYLVSLLLIFLIIIGGLAITSNIFYDKLNDKRAGFEVEVRDSLTDNLAKNVLFYNNLDYKDYEIKELKIVDGEYFFDDSIYVSGKRFYFDCYLPSLKCQQEDIDAKTMGSFYTDDGSYPFLFTKNEKAVVILPELVLEEFTQVPLFQFKILAADKYKVAATVQEEYNDLMVEIADYDYEISYSLFDKVYNIFSLGFVSEYFDASSIYIYQFVDMFRIIKSSTSKETQELNDFDAGKPFSDGNENLYEHVLQLKKDTISLLPRYKEALDAKKSALADGLDEMFLQTFPTRSILERQFSDIILEISAFERIRSDVLDSMKDSNDQKLDFINRLLDDGEEDLDYRSNALRYRIAQSIMEDEIQKASDDSWLDDFFDVF